MIELKGWLCGRVLRLRLESGRAELAVFDADTGGFLTLGGGDVAGTPLLGPGGLQGAVQLVALPGDPPDPVMVGGDFVYLRRMQPDFTLSPTGDLTIVEGA